MSAIALIKNTLPIVDVLEKYTSVNVRSNRRQYNIRCPFHNDHNPSFTVYTDSDTFRCWSGCNGGKTGDVINIVELSQGVNTNEAIKILISDYGLEKPNSIQTKEWQKKRADLKWKAALKKDMNRKVFDAIDALKEVEQSATAILKTIKSEKDLERLGDLYHVLIQIDYWLECLVENDIAGQIRALHEVAGFLERMKEGKGA
ncbi:CHC2 zinc finger domain-containing protein [Bacillus safensis]|uniref:CHC2 zinc finger domain-containing protein n=1 Tax=Bacillus safensis TaxID=561879 RepID=UPI0023430C0D|nr:CHC2 zinc finger domain-containing protein [Bacillus safensis]WCL57026.1 CHC2 zinc finger domain-containing protein [Bacillus safensis]